MNLSDERRRILSGLGAEVTFALLPLLVVLMVMIYAGRFPLLFSSPEWSFGAAILFGQAVVKFVAGLARAGAAAPGPVALVVTLVVVFGLVPSLIILTMLLLSAESLRCPALWLEASQILLFFCAAILYLVLGTVGEEWGKADPI